MSTGRQRDEVGTELIRAAQGKKGRAAEQEDHFMCKVVSWAMANFYRKGWLSFGLVAVDPAYESAQPRYPITPDVDSESQPTMPNRELMRTWRILGKFGNLPREKRHLPSRQAHGNTLPLPRDIVEFEVEIQGYFHSYRFGWEPGVLLISFIEGNQPETVTTMIECRNRTFTKGERQIYRPKMTLYR